MRLHVGLRWWVFAYEMFLGSHMGHGGGTCAYGTFGLGAGKQYTIADHWQHASEPNSAATHTVDRL